MVFRFQRFGRRVFSTFIENLLESQNKLSHLKINHQQIKGVKAKRGASLKLTKQIKTMEDEVDLLKSSVTNLRKSQNGYIIYYNDTMQEIANVQAEQIEGFSELLKKAKANYIEQLEYEASRSKNIEEIKERIEEIRSLTPDAQSIPKLETHIKEIKREKYEQEQDLRKQNLLQYEKRDFFEIPRVELILDQFPITIKETKEFGRGVYATKNFNFGDIIFKENPIVSCKREDELQQKLENLDDEEKNIIENLHKYNPDEHEIHNQMEIFYHNALSSHLYPVGSLLNHSCFGNCIVDFQSHEFLASRNIEAGEEITTYYLKPPSVTMVDPNIRCTTNATCWCIKGNSTNPINQTFRLEHYVFQKLLEETKSDTSYIFGPLKTQLKPFYEECAEFVEKNEWKNQNFNTDLRQEPGFMKFVNEHRDALEDVMRPFLAITKEQRLLHLS